MKAFCSAALAALIWLAGLAIPTPGKAATISFTSLPFDGSEIDGGAFNAQGLNLSALDGAKLIGTLCQFNNSCLRTNILGGRIEGTFVLPGANIPAQVTRIFIDLEHENSITQVFSPSGDLVLQTPSGFEVNILVGGPVGFFRVLLGSNDALLRVEFDGMTSVDPVPLPAALPLFATVLGAGGIVAWRRKRQTAKLAA